VEEGVLAFGNVAGNENRRKRVLFLEEGKEGAFLLCRLHHWLGKILLTRY
jgi:hypothetical protein